MMSNKLKFLTISLQDEFPVESTAKAYRITAPDRSVWLPKSQIQEWKIENGKVSFWIPEWLVKEKGLEIFIDTSYEPSLF